MRIVPRAAVVFASCLLLPAGASAQLCFDIFEDLTDPSLSCADTFYFVDGPDGASGFDQFGDGSTGLLGAEFDGFDLFDPEDPELAPPDNLLEPFFSDIQYNQTNIGGQINSFQARHRGGVSMRARDSNGQFAVYGTKSRITFIPFTTDGNTDPVILDLDFDFDFTLADPLDNMTRGGALAGASARIFDPDDPLEPLFNFDGLADLDLDFNDEPNFFDDFNGPASSFEPSGPGIDDEFDIDIDFDTTFQATPGRPLTLDTDSFGQIFTDGFESGDTSAWSASSIDTFVFTVSSSNPNVRFMFIVEAEQPSEISGLWFDSTLDGEGYNVIQSAAGTTIFYYGNDQSGNKLWLVSDTLSDPLILDETVEFPMFVGGGDGTFDSPAPSSALTSWGTLAVTVDTCTSGTFALDGDDGVKNSQVVQLAGIEGVVCDAQAGKAATAGPVLQPAGDTTPISGLWYDPGLDGEGYNVIQSAAGTTIFFYGYDQAGNRLWLVSDTLGEAVILDQTLVFPMLVGAAGTFAAPAPSTQLAAWGTLEVTIDSCTSGSFVLAGADGNKTSNAVLLAGIEGIVCE